MSILLAIFFFTACSAIYSTNGFNNLKRSELKFFPRFDINNTDKVINYEDSFVLERINHNNISVLNTKYPILWIHTFAPWCTGVSCENVGRYQKMAESCGPNVKLVLIALSYNIDDLKQKLAQSGIDHIVYVLDTCYSRIGMKADRQFFVAIKKEAPYPNNYNCGDYILRNDSLLYIKNGRQPDSVFLNVARHAVRGGPVPKQTWW